MNNGYVLITAAVCLTGISQVLLKSGALQATGRNWIHTYVNPRVILAFLLLFSATLCSTKAYITLPVSSALFLLPSTYLWVGFLSHILLHELMTPRQYIGMAVIVLGMLVYNA